MASASKAQDIIYGGRKEMVLEAAMKSEENTLLLALDSVKPSFI